MNKSAAKKENLTESLVKDTIAANQEEAKMPIDKDFSFSMPAAIVNNFQLAINSAYVRIAALEVAPSGTPLVRACIAVDYKTLAMLHNMIGRFLEDYQRTQMAVLTPENLAAIQKYQESQNGANTAENPTDGSQAEVG